ncbi:MAG: YceI family protein [Saprospiraceae bacterium]|jgi:polyisoprenoid-binding protein YceI|nr:YceI family protein [Saprospiraceae bacterium]
MKKLIFFFFAFLVVGFSLVAQDYKLTKSSVKMSGTSTLHDWTADVTKVSGNGQLTFSNNALSGIKSLNITMTTNSIKSSKGETMDKNMRKELKDKDYPTMTYALTKVNSVTPKAGGYALETEGKLTIAGTTKTINLSVTGTVNGGQITFKGSKKLKMTDFNVEPPVMFLGTLKTADEVTITFETTFSNSTVK